MSDSSAAAETPAEACRRVARACRTATLATTLAGSNGQPYASLVLVAFGQDAAPVLLMSDLAEHTRNLDAEPRASLLLDGTAGFAEPLTGPRVTLVGRISRTDAPELRARYLARHPSAEMYAGFRDFSFFRLQPERAHIVAGFGRIHWLEDYLLAGDLAEVTATEAEICAHMNEDHADAIELYATRLLGRGGTDWRMCGVDAEGADLIRDGELARLPFARPAFTAEAIRAELVKAAKRARAV